MGKFLISASATIASPINAHYSHQVDDVDGMNSDKQQQQQQHHSERASIASSNHQPAVE